jgi:IS30 family transposase
LARRGRKRRLDLEDEYWKLITNGTGTFEACRLVGIGRKTGYRWRHERGGLPPVRLSDECRCGRYLSLLERHRIATLRARGESMRSIARALDRSPSTISRELRRNTAAHDRGVYDGDLAHARTRAWATRAKPGKLRTDACLRALVQQRLDLDWSPEQVAAWLRLEHPDRTEWHVCHETIYQALYSPGKSGLSRRLTTRLRTGRPMRRRRKHTAVRAPRFRSLSKLIDERPAIADARSRIGDWEGDLICGSWSTSAIGTLVDRHSRFVRLVHLPHGHDSQQVRDALARVFGAMSPAERLTLTWDQGPEMASHEGIGHLFGDGVYFAHAGSPWQRATNENTNGLLRQYFPKGSDLSAHDQAELERVERLLNERPRKTLGWRTPAQAYQAAVSSSKA